MGYSDWKDGNGSGAANDFWRDAAAQPPNGISDETESILRRGPIGVADRLDTYAANATPAFRAAGQTVFDVIARAYAAVTGAGSLVPGFGVGAFIRAVARVAHGAGSTATSWEIGGLAAGSQVAPSAGLRVNALEAAPAGGGSTVELLGSVAMATVAVTATGTIPANVSAVIVNAGANNITLTLPNPAQYPGRQIAFTRAPNSTGAVVIASAGGQVQARSGPLGATTTLPVHSAGGNGVGILFRAFGGAWYR